jgi:hypothetical protein
MTAMNEFVRSVDQIGAVYRDTNGERVRGEPKVLRNGFMNVTWNRSGQRLPTCPLFVAGRELLLDLPKLDEKAVGH